MHDYFGDSYILVLMIECAPERSSCGPAELSSCATPQVLLTCVIAISIPKLQDVVALFGSFNAPLLAVILPPLLAMKLKIGSRAIQVVHGALAFIFFLWAVAATCFVAYEIVTDE